MTPAASSPDTLTGDQPGLRRLGLSVAAAIVVANMVGSGVFGAAGFQAAALRDPWTILATWVVGGVLALCGAASYAELGARMPHAGGEYVYLREAYHPVVGFMSGWTSLTAGFSAPIAVAAIVFSKYLAALVAPLAGLESVIAIALIGLVTLMHSVDTVLGGRVQTAFTAGKVALISLMIVAGLLGGDGSWAHFAPREGGLGNVFTESFAVSLMYVSFAYSGWNAAAYIAGEIREPRRTLPRALLYGTAVVMGLYVLLHVVFLYAVPPQRLAAGSDGGPVIEVGHVAAVALFGDSAGRLISTLIALALVSSVSAMVMAGPRVYAAMAGDRALPAIMALRNRRGVPVVSVVLQGALACLFVLVGKDRLEKLLQYIGFSLAVFTTLAVGSVFVFRLRDARAKVATPKGTYRTWGYPVTPIAFMALSAWIAYAQFRASKTESAMVAGTLLVGAVVYLLTVARSAKAAK